MLRPSRFEKQEFSLRVKMFAGLVEKYVTNPIAEFCPARLPCE
jgi:hypothetical protein